MAQKRWSLSIPLDNFTLAEHAAIAREAEQLGYTDAWSLEVDGIDGFSPLAVVGAETTLRLGTAIANVYTRGPATLAMTAAGIAEIAPRRFCLGIGAGSQPIVELWNGGKFAQPTLRVREMATFLKQAFAGDRVVFQGQTFSVNGFRLSRPLAHPIPIYIAALRPAMLRVAGEVGDGAIINWLSADDVRKSVQVVREAAAKAGRDPNAIEITARVFIAIDPPTPEADIGVRRHINTYLNVPVYKAFQKWLGRETALTPMWEAWDKGDRKGAVAAVPEQVMNELVLRGSPDNIRAHVRRYMDAGVDTAFLQFHTFETDPGLRRERLLNALRALAPGRN
ncbi:MAG: LLM class F420-dependent oxidoreductase [Candidatus Binatia bacterium]